MSLDILCKRVGHFLHLFWLLLEILCAHVKDMNTKIRKKLATVKNVCIISLFRKQWQTIVNWQENHKQPTEAAADCSVLSRICT